MPGFLWIVGVIIAFLAVALIVTSHRNALFWVAFVTPFFPIAYIDRYYFDLPSALKWIPFLGVFFAGAAAMLLLPRLRAEIPRSLIAAYAAIVLVSLGSMALNDTHWAAFLVSQRGWVVLFAALLAMKTAYGVYGKGEIFGFMVTAGMISSGICILQRIFVVPFVGGDDPGDRVTGLFPVGFISLFFHLFCIGIVLSYWLEGRKVVRWHPGWVLLLLVGGIGSANQKAALPYLFAMLGFIILTAGAATLRGRSLRLGPLVAALVAPALLLMIFTSVYDSAYERSSESYSASILDPDYLERYLFGDENVKFTPSGRLLRGGAIVFAHRLVSRDVPHLLVGMGPGSTSESRVPGAAGHLSQRYPGYAIDRVALSMFLAETGFVGIAMHLVLLLVIGFWNPPPTAHQELPEYKRIRKIFVFLAVSYVVYGNLYYEPIYGLMVAAVLYPIIPIQAAAGKAKVSARSRAQLAHYARHSQGVPASPRRHPIAR